MEQEPLSRLLPDLFDPVEPDFGDDPTLPIPVEAIRAYSVGQLPLPVQLARIRSSAPREDDLEMRVARVKVDGQWIPL